MSHVIRIPQTLYSRLEHHAEGFDTPVNVIEKLLNYRDGLGFNKVTSVADSLQSSRDYSKYYFNGSYHNKCRLVLSVVKFYVNENKPLSSIDLLQIFPRRLQGSIGVFNTLEYINEKYSEKSKKRHFISPNEIIELSDTKIAVCTQWGAGRINNINNFVSHARTMGYEISN